MHSDIALPAYADQVAPSVHDARRHDLRITVQGTGHNAAPPGDPSDTLLIGTHRMRGVTIDPRLRVALVEAGALWGDVVGPAGEHALAALAGSSHDVGVVGYTLGGGMSWLARRYGLSANMDPPAPTERWPSSTPRSSRSRRRWRRRPSSRLGARRTSDACATRSRHSTAAAGTSTSPNAPPPPTHCSTTTTLARLRRVRAVSIPAACSAPTPVE